jgi:act minimal PKS acyl carrier protein
VVQLITLRELENIMRQYVWEGSWLSFEQAPDRRFDELGYDSLALLETHSRIKRDYGVEISENDLGHIETPQGMVDFVNARLKAT